MQPKVLAIHDLAGRGRCSLTVALPILSVCGIECVVLPTAVLSTQTSDISGFTFHDLSQELPLMVDHYEQLNFQFDAIYTGFVGSIQQLQLLPQWIKRLSHGGTQVIIDPVMADGGKLYATYDMNFVQVMREVIKVADVILPNLTEACLLADVAYHDGLWTKAEIEALLKKLSGMTKAWIVLTGVMVKADQIGYALYHQSALEVGYGLEELVDGTFYGTGDIFASTVVAGLVHHRPLPQAVQLALQFTLGAIKRSIQYQTNPVYGVPFEPGLVALGKEFIND